MKDAVDGSLVEALPTCDGEEGLLPLPDETLSDMQIMNQVRRRPTDETVHAVTCVTLGMRTVAQ
ncbi:hypothetical protein NKG60_28165 [Mesorhizobium sp. M1428]|uniref:hypothetical protein n=1 Tax=Mesorhizobium sp. M1428 TaxID=2957102 RepID=UPI0033356A2E